MLLNPPAAAPRDQAASGHAALAPNLCFPAAPLHLERIQADLLGGEPPELVSLLRLSENGGAPSSSAASSTSALLSVLSAVPAAAHASAAMARPHGFDAGLLVPTTAAVLEEAATARAQQPKATRACDCDEPPRPLNPKQYRRIMKRRQARAKYGQIFPDARPILQCYYSHEAGRRSGKKVRAKPDARAVRNRSNQHRSVSDYRAAPSARCSRTSTSRVTSTRARASAGREDAS